MTLDPALAAVRLAVRRTVADLDGPGALLVACSGGADSLALLAAAVVEGHRADRRVVGVTVDHGLQRGSQGHAEHVVAQMAALGADETVAIRVDVRASGQGPEAAAREARHTVLEEVAQRIGGVVLLGHTRDDQAETVLLGLTRGSGARSMAGMRRSYDVFRRPLLSVSRAQTEAACLAEGIGWWRDPHNDDPRFTRSRVRHTVLPMLERELGPGISETLARTAEQLQEDVAALDALAERAFEQVRDPGGRLEVVALTRLEPAVRRRVVRLAAVAAGCPPGELFRVHVLAVERLVTAYRGQRWVDLPGHRRAAREGGHVRIETSGESATGAVGG